MIERRSIALPAVLILAFCGTAYSHTIPDNVTAQVFLRPSRGSLYMLVRIPFDALADTVFPSRADGDLDLPQVDLMLPDAAKTWISDWVDVYEGDSLLPKPRVVETRVSLGSDNSFRSYEDAWAHVTGARLPATVQVYPDRAMFDVLFEYPIRSDRSTFAIHSRLSRLGVTVVTVLRFITSGGPVRTFAYEGDPGLFPLDPGWGQAARRFFLAGMVQILRGFDYLLFVFCAALLFRTRQAEPPAPQPQAQDLLLWRRRFRLRSPIAFAVASSITLIGSAYGLAPDAIWFPVLFETLIGASVAYLALESIVRGGWIPTAAFGLIFGFGFSFALRGTLQFGGSRVLTSVLSYTAGIQLGLCVALAAFILALHLLFQIAPRAERIGTIFLAALVAHTGWHRMLDRAQWLRASQIPWPNLTPGLWVALSLAAASLVYFGSIISSRRVFPRDR
jgi:hypothetical protein